jgi:hypothetical protein
MFVFGITELVNSFLSLKGAGGCALPPCVLPQLRTTGVGRRGVEALCARRFPQRSPGKGVRRLTVTSMRTTALGSMEWAARLIRAESRARGPRRGVEAAAVRAPLLCISTLHPKQTTQRT